jgi:hypothetical protein
MIKNKRLRSIRPPHLLHNANGEDRDPKRYRLTDILSLRVSLDRPLPCALPRAGRSCLLPLLHFSLLGEGTRLGDKQVCHASITYLSLINTSHHSLFLPIKFLLLLGCNVFNEMARSYLTKYAGRQGQWKGW